MVEIDAHRLLDDLKTLRSYGTCGPGVVRRALTPIDMDSRRWLVGRMQEAGLEAHIDGIGTVIGRSPGVEKALLLGSHTDTQPRGGWLDGALGVIYGLEVARALREAGLTASVGVDVASWIDEEGHFSGLMGSRAFCGQLAGEMVDKLRNDAGQTLREAIEAAGLGGRDWEQLDAKRYLGYIEAHIEQGPYLEEEGNRIGVVTGIVGIRAFRLTFTGQQNHAGTTPMPRRKDAARALISLAHELNDTFARECGERTVWTIGQITVDPGAVSIVPGGAQMMFQFRDVDAALLDHLEKLFREAVDKANREGPVAIGLEQTAGLAPAVMADELQAHIAEAAESHAGGVWTRMPSAAGHDAQVLSRHLPAGMLFIPSINGISHSFEEDTAEEDIVLGCRVLADAAASFVRAQSAQH